MAEISCLPVSAAFETQLKTLCLKEFPCGSGPWRKPNSLVALNKSTKKKNKIPVNVDSIFAVTLKDYGANTEKTETLEEYVGSKFSPWHLDYSWSDEAKELREISVKSPWLIDDHFVLNYFKNLRIVDKDVTEVDENLLKFKNLENLTLSANYITSIDSRNLPPALQVLELCANQIRDLSSLCIKPPPELSHLGLGYNKISYIGDYITGDNWPCLLSLDLCNNNLTDLLDVVRKLDTLPKLRNLILQGNPLSFIPGYRGYIIDSLRKLSILDDLLITADEKHHFKGLARRREYILDEAKMTLSVPYIKGIPIPEEKKNPEDQPEYPIIERSYYVEFQFLEDTSSKTEICLIPDIDNITEISTQLESPRIEEQSIMPSEMMESETLEEEEPLEKNVYFNSQPDLKNLEINNEFTPGAVETYRATSEAIEPKPIKLTSIITDKLPWTEELELNWSKTIIRDNLISLRDFFKQGMQLSVMEETVLCYPQDEDAEISSPVSSKKPDKSGAAGKGDKKAKGGKPEKDDGKKKKKKEPEVELKRMPPQISTLATFTLELGDFLDGEFSVKSIFTHGEVEPSPTVESLDTDKKDAKGKDGKKKPASPKGGKDKSKEKDGRKSATKGAKDAGADKKGKGKPVVPPVEEGEETLPPPPLELEVCIDLHHWKTATDSLKEEEKTPQ